MKTKFASAKALVVRNQKKFVIASLAVTTAGTVLMFRNQKMFNEFLKEHNLLDEYYTIEEA